MLFQRIRDLREDANLTQAEMAKVLSCYQQTYSAYELGKQIIPPDVLISLARFHNTSVDYLLDLTNVREPYPRIK